MLIVNLLPHDGFMSLFQIPWRLAGCPPGLEEPMRSEERRVFRSVDRPIVHLGVNVDRELAAPRRVHVAVPNTLEIGGLPARPRGADEIGRASCIPIC